MGFPKSILSGAAAWLLAGNIAFASEDIDAMLDLSIEELTNIEITSHSKRSERATEVAASVHVLTHEDIRRSGATSIPEALRLVPGVQVNRAGAQNWIVTARGFGAQFANKLLVLIDGRTVYSPLFSGVFWDVQDTLLEDIDRIEVIKGPGGTIWGANAVNGVINIITKHSKDTQGALAQVTYGSHDRIGAARYGGSAGEATHYRGYVKYKDHEEYDLPDGSGANDDWQQLRAEWRIDSQLSDKSELTVQAGIYDGDETVDLQVPFLSAPFIRSVADEFNVSGTHLLSKWNYRDAGHEYSLQGYYDLVARNTFVFKERSHTFDLDFNHSLPRAGMHQLMWGMGYRLIHTDTQGTPLISFSPEQRSDNLFTGFIQNKMELVDEALFLTLGSKFEHNDYSGFEWQPSARLAWLLNENHTLWTSATRAVRTPTRLEHDVSVAARPLVTQAGTVLLRQTPNERVDAEEVISYEAGYRMQPTENTSLDLSLFYNDYRTLVDTTTGLPSARLDAFYGPHLSVPVALNDSGSGETSGLELALNWQATENWRLHGSFTYLAMDIDMNSTLTRVEAQSPEYQFNLNSRYSFDNGIEWDQFLYYVDELAAADSYWRLDTRLGWEMAEGFELSLVGQNLLDNRHRESGAFLYSNTTEVPRSFYGQIIWRY